MRYKTGISINLNARFSYIKAQCHPLFDVLQLLGAGSVTTSWVANLTSTNAVPFMESSHNQCSPMSLCVAHSAKAHEKKTVPSCSTCRGLEALWQNTAAFILKWAPIVHFSCLLTVLRPVSQVGCESLVQSKYYIGLF